MGLKQTSLKVNIVRVLFANFWVAAISFVGSFIFPRILSIESYAQYHQFTLYVSYIAVLHLGFPSGMVINYAGIDIEKIEKKQLRSELSIVFWLLTFFSIVTVAIAVLLQSKAIMYIALIILPYCAVGSYRALLQAWNQFKTYSRISMLVSIAVPILAFSIYVLTGSLNGDQYILAYLLVYYVAFAYTFISLLKHVKGVRSNPLISRKNWHTERTGAAMLAGNYINTLFVSADKQFVNLFFSTTEFAYYSFGMSLQALMTVFITSIAQPLFPAMAQGKWKDEEYNKIKELLFIFGSLSGCAYFAASIIVELFIQKYIASLRVVEIYFMIFPAMAVVNCIYVNLYKIKRKMNTYIKTLIGLLLIAIGLNLLMVKTYGQYTGVAIATTMVYYIWLLIGTKQFEFIRITIRDLAYLGIYNLIFILCIHMIKNAYMGFIIYGVLIVLLAVICYGKNLKGYISIYKSR